MPNERNMSEKMVNSGILNELITSIYESIDDFSQWDVILQKINSPFRTESGTLYYGLEKDRLNSSHHFSNGSSSLFSSAFHLHFGHISPTYRFISNGPNGRATTTKMVMPMAEYHKTEFFNDYFRPNGFNEVLSTKIDEGSGRIIIIALRGSLNREIFSSDEVSVFNLLCTHIRRACRVHERIGNLDGLKDSVLTAMDRLSRGALLLGERGRVLHVNAEARRIIELRDGIELTRDGLHCASSADERRLNLLVRDALKPTLSAAPGTAFISRPSGRPAYVAWAVAANPSFLVPEQAAVRTILTLTDPDRQNGKTPVLSSQFQLTPGEAAVATALSSGLNAAEIAEARDVSINTIRSLRSRAYAKLGVESQSALVRLVGSLPQA
jgi:DNA-binding CsgD family transcriptional regulator